MFVCVRSKDLHIGRITESESYYLLMLQARDAPSPIVEARIRNHTWRHGLQHGRWTTPSRSTVPFAYSSNGNGESQCTTSPQGKVRRLGWTRVPVPRTSWKRYRESEWGFSTGERPIGHSFRSPLFITSAFSSAGNCPAHYQRANAGQIRTGRIFSPSLKGQNRLLLVMCHRQVRPLNSLFRLVLAICARGGLG